MITTKFYFYLGLIFFIIAVIGAGFLIFGIYMISAYDQPVAIVLNIIIMGIILLPIGLIFAIVFFYQNYSAWKKQKNKE